MSNWQPEWKSDPDPKPRDVYYEWLDENTGETIFAVEVSAGGLIQVVEDDWLSKYTKAIYGDFDTYARFIRINPANKSISNIGNVDLIYEGETILHTASFLAFEAWVKPILTTDGDVPDNVPDEIFNEIQSIVNWTTATAAIEVLGWILEFAAVNPAWGAGVALLALPAGLWSAIGDIVEVNNPEITAEQFFAIIYATTAWVYDDTSDSTLYPTTTEDLGEFNQCIPELPYQVPHGVANPKSWFIIHGYKTAYGQGRMSKDLILNKLNLLKSKWQETSAATIEKLVGTLYYNASHPVIDGILTLDQYKKNLRSIGPIMVPGKRKPVLMSKQVFSKALMEQTYKTFLENWVGPLTPVLSIKSKLSLYVSFYPLPK